MTAGYKILIYCGDSYKELNKDFYKTISVLTLEISEKRKEIVSFIPDLHSSNNFLGEVKVLSKNSANELKKRLNHEGLCKKVVIIKTNSISL